MELVTGTARHRRAFRDNSEHVCSSSCIFRVREKLGDASERERVPLASFLVLCRENEHLRRISAAG